MPPSRRSQRVPRIVTIVGASVLVVVCGAMLLTVLWLAGFHIWPAQSATIIGQNCGEVHAPVGQKATPTPDVARVCLWMAYQQCTTATVIYTDTIVDVAWRHFVTVRPQSGHCTVQDAVEFHNYNRRTQSVTVYSCKSLSQSSAGMIVTGCGDEGDVTIP